MKWYNKKHNKKTKVLWIILGGGIFIFGIPLLIIVWCQFKIGKGTPVLLQPNSANTIFAALLAHNKNF